MRSAATKQIEGGAADLQLIVPLNHASYRTFLHMLGHTINPSHKPKELADQSPLRCAYQTSLYTHVSVPLS